MRYGTAAALATLGAALTMRPSPVHARDAGELTIEVIAANLSPDRYVWDDATTVEPVSIVINLREQSAYVYRGDRLVAASAVSTGKGGKETPLGGFSILQKKRDHRSNLYNNAAMPYMQRLTWDGVAIHAGRNPGFPASHGCIRLPTEFARKLFAVTALGTPVRVVDAAVIVAPPAAYETADEAAAHVAAQKVAMATAALPQDDIRSVQALP